VHAGAPKRCFLTQLRESSLYRSRIVNTWGFDMDDVKAVIEQATDAAMGTPPEAPAEAPKSEMGSPPETPKPEMGTPPEAPAEPPKPEMKKVRPAAKKVGPKNKVGKKAKTSAKKSAKKAPKKAKAKKKKAKKAKR
jgi:hypothetical protein